MRCLERPWVIDMLRDLTFVAILSFMSLLMVGLAAYVISRMGVLGYFDGLRKARKENHNEEG